MVETDLRQPTHSIDAYTCSCKWPLTQTDCVLRETQADAE